MELDPLPTHHPTSHPNPHHRKIELQSPLDLTYLQTNLSTSAQQKLDLHFPPSALHRKAQPATFIALDGAAAPPPPSQIQPQAQSQVQYPNQEEIENDPLRARVQSLVSTFLQRTWAGAAQNITINGLDASSLTNTNSSNLLPPSTSTSNAHPDSISTQQSQSQSHPQSQPQEREGIHYTYAPYDARLQTHLASLHGELESVTAQVSRLRREAPSSSARGYAEELTSVMGREEEEYVSSMRGLREEREWSGSGNGNALELQEVRDGYVEDVRGTYERGLEELGRLSGVSGVDGRSGEDSSSRNGTSAAVSGGSLTETVGKVQRARTVAVEFE